MAGYLVVGSGKAKKGVIERNLADLQKAHSTKKGADLWLAVPVTDEVTPEIERVLDWAMDKQVVVEVYIGKGVDIDAELEESLGESLLEARNPLTAAYKALAKEGDAEGALVLYDDDAEGDDQAELLAEVEQHVGKLLEFNAGLEPIELAPEDEPAADEPEDDEPKPRGKRKAEAEDEPEEKPAKSKKAEPADEDKREELAALRITSLRKMYRDGGYGDPGDMSKEDLIAALLDRPEAPGVKENAAPSPAAAGSTKVLMVVHMPSGIHVANVDIDTVREFIKAHT